MSGELNHTELPWKVRTETDDDGEIEEVQVVQDEKDFSFGYVEVATMGQSERDDAEFIVRACNSYYQLLAACEYALAWLDAQPIRTSLAGQIRDAIAKGRGEDA